MHLEGIESCKGYHSHILLTYKVLTVMTHHSFGQHTQSQSHRSPSDQGSYRLRPAINVEIFSTIITTRKNYNASILQ